MADKIASGAWHEGGPPPKDRPDAGDPRDAKRTAEIERLTSKRDNARWSAVVGFAMLFGAGFAAAFAIGGLLMIVYGAAASVYWSRRLTKVKGDPWQFDPELDGPQAPDWARR